LTSNRGLSLVELLVVLAIISVLLGLLLPAVQAARERARETVCKNNLHQLNLALGQFAEVHKQLPPPFRPGKVGGWTVEILPFLEQGNLKDAISQDLALSDAPVHLNVPWLSGPEVRHQDVLAETGPHHGGFFFASGFQQGVSFMLSGREIR
jgi:prepilin-type N-terminal cleavage/methylation domain-containing protein